MSISRPGNIDIQEMYLTTPAGKILDISSLFAEMSIYENISSSSLTGVIVMVDTHNLISTMPLLGEEWFMFKYKVFETDEARSMIFKIYKIDDREIQGNKQVYKMYFTSLETFINATKNVSKTFTGHAETIISQLLKNHLESAKPIEADASGNLLKLTAPWWSPLRCIGWASQKAVSADQYRTSDFLFYETMSGFKFRNMSLSKVRKPKAAFVHNHSRAVQDDFTRQFGQEMSQVLDFYTPLIVDQIDRFRHAVYKTQVFAHDTTFKAINIYNHNIDETWDKSFHLNKFKPYSNSLMSMVSPDVRVATESSYLHDDKQYDWQGLITGQRNPSLMLNELMQVDIEVWGRMGLEAGDVVDMTVGKFTQDDTENNDPYYSGNYLISSVVHRFAPKEYKMNIRLVKDSVPTEFK